MTPLQYFSPQPAASAVPDRLSDPFDNTPHELAQHASRLLQDRIQRDQRLCSALFGDQGGKMLGVLVVKDTKGSIGFLAAFCGQLMQQWLVDGFVPPVFDMNERQLLVNDNNTRLAELNRQIADIESDPSYLQARQHLRTLTRQQQGQLACLRSRHKQRKQHRHAAREKLENGAQTTILRLRTLAQQSRQDKFAYQQLRQQWQQRLGLAQTRLQARYEQALQQLRTEKQALLKYIQRATARGYCITNRHAEQVPMASLFANRAIPFGAGDCVAPKLLQYAHHNGLAPVAFAQFWWGAPDQQGIHHHGHYYPPCRGRCRPVLQHMLAGVALETRRSEPVSASPEIIHQDEDLIVVNKPAGMLSVPGKHPGENLQAWMQRQLGGSIYMVHRLDMATSGLLVAARNRRAAVKIQQQFVERKVEKRYTALLDRPLTEKYFVVDLPLRVDLDDRPRQRVCYQHGRQAVTRGEIIGQSADSCRVYLYPKTGRTHQLRVHAAHPLGLNAPIMGDDLYGARGSRLMLHADRLAFEQPTTGQCLEFESSTAF